MKYMALNEQMRLEAIKEAEAIYSGKDTRTKKEMLQEQMEGLKTVGKTAVENIPGVGEAILAKDIAGDVSEGNYASAALGAAALGVGFLPAGDILNKPIKAAAKKLRKQDANVANKMLKDVDSIDTWKKQNPNPKPQKQNPDIEKAANDLLEGNITGKQYRSVVKENMPIVKIEEVPEVPSFTEIVGALDKDKSAKGILGLNKTVKDGTRVASRLDIPAYERFDKWVVSVHDAFDKKGRESLNGDIMGYGKTAILKNVEFKGMSQGAANISAKKNPKGTIARIFGDYYNAEPENVAEYAAQAIKDKNYTQVGYNPFRHGFFYDKDTGMPVKSAEEVIQVGPLVLAKNAQKMKISEAKQVSPKGGIKIRTGKPIEGFQNLKETKTVFNEGGIVPMRKQMELFEQVQGAFNEGGLMQEGGTVDPESGNEVPVGSMQEEVRDDIPAQLSEGEFVFPADVVRYIGLEKLMQMRQEAKRGLEMMDKMGQMGNADEAVIPDDIPFDMSDLDMEDDGMVEFAEGGVVEAQQGTFVPPTGVNFTPGVQRQSQYTAPDFTTPIMPPVQPPVMPPIQPPVQGPVQSPVPTLPQSPVPGIGDFLGGGQGGQGGGAAQLITIVNTKTGAERQINFIPGVTQIPEGFVRKEDYTPTEKPTTETPKAIPTVQQQQEQDESPADSLPSTTDATGVAYDRGKIKNKDLKTALSAAGMANLKDVGPSIAALFTGSATGVLTQMGKKAGQAMGYLAGNKQHAGAVLGGVLDEFRGEGEFSIGKTALDQLSDLQQQQIADTFKSVTEKMSDFYTKEVTDKDGNVEIKTKSQSEIMDSLRAEANRLTSAGYNISTTFTDRRGNTRNKSQGSLEREISKAYAMEIGNERREERKQAAAQASVFGISPTKADGTPKTTAELRAEQKAAEDAAKAEAERQKQSRGFQKAGLSYADESETSDPRGNVESTVAGLGGYSATDYGGIFNKGGLAQQMKQSGLASKK